MGTRVKSQAEQHGETPRAIPTRLRREITASAQGTQGGIISAFFQICRLTFAYESCWNEFFRPPGAARPRNLILEYLEDGPVGVSDTLMREALQRLVPEQAERIMGKWTQTYFDQGKAEGRTQGRAEGGAKMLVRLIEKRFGVVSPQLRQRIFSADVATLEAWVERLLDAPDLQSVFESN